MNTLNLGSDEIPATKKKSNTRNLKIALGLAAVILVPTIGSTLAGTITVSTTGETEFAQGFVGTVACDDAIDITPRSIIGPDGFYLDRITIGGVLPACDGKVFGIAVGNPSGGLEIIGTETEVLCRFQYYATGTAETASGSGGCPVGGSADGTFYFYPFNDYSIYATSVAQITIESSNS
jgi:hypothetical protein